MNGTTNRLETINYTVVFKQGGSHNSPPSYPKFDNPSYLLRDRQEAEI